MTTKSMGIRNVGIAKRVMAYFEANPAEELTYADLAMKFGITQGRARQSVYALRAKGLPVEAVFVIRHTSAGVAK